MAFIRFECRCGKRIKVPAELAGRSGQCPSCGVTLAVPSAQVEQPLQPPNASTVYPDEPIDGDASSEAMNAVAAELTQDYAATSPPKTEVAREPAGPPTCPSCRSQNVQRLAMAHKTGSARIAGVADTSSRTVGVGPGGFSVGMSRGRAKFRADQQSLHASESAPPAMRSVPPALWAIGCLTVFLFPLVLLYHFQLSKWNTTAYREELNDWSEMWVCNACGRRWMPPSRYPGVWIR